MMDWSRFFLFFLFLVGLIESDLGGGCFSDAPANGLCFAVGCTGPVGSEIFLSLLIEGAIL